jgi:hypothetical protein
MVASDEALAKMAADPSVNPHLLAYRSFLAGTASATGR